MRIIPKDTILTIREMKLKTGIVVKATRAVADNKTTYDIRYTDDGPNELVMMGVDAFDRLLQVDPAKSAPVLYKLTSIYSVALAQRADEFYRLVKGGHGNYPGNELLADTMRDYGLQKKILVKGTQVDHRSETLKVDAHSRVKTKHPIINDQITVRKAGGALEVAGYDPKRGVIELDDDGPVTEGTTVEVQYRTTDHLVVGVTDNGHKPIAMILSKELNDYLVANR